MITIEQIQKLDQKVQAAVRRITALSTENSSLKGKLESYQKRISELEVLIERFKKDQSEIESGILKALEQLDRLEDSIDSGEETQLNPNSSKAAPVPEDEAAAGAEMPEQDTMADAATVRHESPSGGKAQDDDTEPEDNHESADEEELDIF